MPALLRSGDAVALIDRGTSLRTIALNFHHVAENFVPKEAVTPYVVSLSEFIIHGVAPTSSWVCTTATALADCVSNPIPNFP